MKACVEHSWVLHNGDMKYNIGKKMLVTVNNTTFLKVIATNQGLSRIILGKEKSKQGVMLSNCSGVARLKELRNQLQATKFAGDAACELFEDEEIVPEATEKKGKKEKISKDMQAKIRSELQMMELEVSLDDGSIRQLNVARPAHPEDSLVIELSSESIALLVEVCNEADVLDKRVYEKSAGTSWRMGGKRRAKMNVSPRSKKRRCTYNGKGKAENAVDEVMHDAREEDSSDNEPIKAKHAVGEVMDDAHKEDSSDDENGKAGNAVGEAVHNLRHQGPSDDEEDHGGDPKYYERRENHCDNT